MRLLHISDTHFFSDHNGEEHIRRLSRIVKETITKYRTDICLHTGDILNRNMPENGYETYLKYWPDCLHVPGNHDNPALMRTLFPEFSSGFPYVTEKNGMQIVGINTSSGMVGEKQLEALKHSLSERENSIVLLHHPVDPLGDSWLDEYLLTDHKELQMVLTESCSDISAVFHGHYHFGNIQKLDGITIIGGSSAAYQYSPREEPKTIASQQGEITVYEITDSGISVIGRTIFSNPAKLLSGSGI